MTARLVLRFEGTEGKEESLNKGNKGNEGEAEFLFKISVPYFCPKKLFE